MIIDSKDYCDNKECPVNTEFEPKESRLSTVYINITVTERDEIRLAAQCLMCKHAKRLDFGNLMKKIVTKSILSDNPVRCASTRIDLANGNTHII